LAARNERKYNTAVKRLNELPKVSSQGVVSEILGGKRQLSVRQIRKLAQRFQVSPAVFV
jgi:HTH-type transcriptional regulator/antitoxin HigA